MSQLTPEIVTFLSEGTRTGKVGWVAQDGRPLVAPIWFVVEDDEVLFNTGRDSAKGKAIARDPRLVMCVDSEVAPYGFVQLQGTTAVSEEPAELLRSATDIARRYVGPDAAEHIGRRNSGPGEILVRLQITKVTAQLDMTG